jgi:hypothetical protein
VPKRMKWYAFSDWVSAAAVGRTCASSPSSSQSSASSPSSSSSQSPPSSPLSPPSAPSRTPEEELAARVNQLAREKSIRRTRRKLG